MFTTFFLIVSLWDFFSANSAVHSRIFPNSSEALWFSSVTAKTKEDPIKNEGAGLFTTLYLDVSDAQGQITSYSVMESGRILNSSNLSCIFSLPTRMKMIQSKIKRLEWSQQFSQSKSMRIFPDAHGQLFP